MFPDHWSETTKHHGFALERTDGVVIYRPTARSGFRAYRETGKPLPLEHLRPVNGRRPRTFKTAHEAVEVVDLTWPLEPSVCDTGNDRGEG